MQPKTKFVLISNPFNYFFTSVFKKQQVKIKFVSLLFYHYLVNYCKYIIIGIKNASNGQMLDYYHTSSSYLSRKISPVAIFPRAMQCICYNFPPHFDTNKLHIRNLFSLDLFVHILNLDTFYIQLSQWNGSLQWKQY